MSMTKSLLMGLLVGSLALVGCSDDDDDDGGTSTGGTGGGDTGGSGGGDTGGSDTGGTDTGGTDTGGSAGEGGMPATGTQCDPDAGACMGETDCGYVEGGELSGTARACGLECLTAPAEERGECAVECIQMDLDGVSAECSACYATSVQCASNNCLGDCATAPDSDECNECLAENCYDDLEECAGITIQ